MPTYEYLCTACRVLSELWHKISDSPKRKCPKCGALKLKRQIGTGGGIIFRGSGFHINDYPKGRRDESDGS